MNLKRRQFLKQMTLGASLIGSGFSGFKCRSAKNRPNVLFIILDDQNNFTEALGDPSIKTPNLLRLAQKSVNFTHAYVAAPACGPSRTAFLTGLRPSTTGVYYNFQRFRLAKDWRADITSLPGLFKQQDYLAAGYGKIFHQGQHQYDDLHSWSEGYFVGFDTQKDFALKEKALAVRGLGSEMWSWGKLPDKYDRKDKSKMQQDTLNTQRAISVIQEKRDQPFFLALGLWKPHLPWYVPKRFYDLYQAQDIPMPEGYREDDLKDVPNCARWLATHRGMHDKMVRNNLWKNAMHAYMASISYADEQVGRVLDALESSEHKDNTIIILCGDNGWHTGEKNHWSKFALWEKANHVPFMISVPGVTNQNPSTHDHPVSLLDIYPTLVDLCGLAAPESHNLEGKSLQGILANPQKDRRAPVISTFGQNCHSIRNKRYRYIRYRNGQEELYDHSIDPYEWENISDDPGMQTVKEELESYLPQVNRPNIYGEEKGGNNWDAKIFNKS